MAKNSISNHAWVFGLLVLSCFFGCNQRQLTPEVEYSDSDVELIRKEIEAFDWD